MATKAELEQEIKKLKEQQSSLTEEEIFSLKAVAHGCNINSKLQNAAFLDRTTDKTISFEKALVTVYKLIERLGDK